MSTAILVMTMARRHLRLDLWARAENAEPIHSLAIDSLEFLFIIFLHLE
jgi:hypothetical protein